MLGGVGGTSSVEAFERMHQKANNTTLIILIVVMVILYYLSLSVALRASFSAG